MVVYNNQETNFDAKLQQKEYKKWKYLEKHEIRHKLFGITLLGSTVFTKLTEISITKSDREMESNSTWKFFEALANCPSLKILKIYNEDGAELDLLEGLELLHRNTPHLEKLKLNSICVPRLGKRAHELKVDEAGNWVYPSGKELVSTDAVNFKSFNVTLKLNHEYDMYDLEELTKDWLIYFSLKYTNLKTLMIDFDYEEEENEYDESDDDDDDGNPFTIFHTTTFEKPMLQILSKMPNLREYGCRLGPITRNIVETVNKVNRRLTSITIWMEPESPRNLI